jgi:predicted nucleic acid-binding protein
MRLSERVAFYDTNILLYLLSADAGKADRAEELLMAGGCLSVQVLNEYAAVASRKLGMNWQEIREALDVVRKICQLVPVDVQTHDRALQIAERYGFSVYDALIVAAALLAGCDTLYSEDLQAGQRIDRQLTVINPFLSG